MNRQPCRFVGAACGPADNPPDNRTQPSLTPCRRRCMPVGPICT